MGALSDSRHPVRTSAPSAPRPDLGTLGTPVRTPAPSAPRPDLGTLGTPFFSDEEEPPDECHSHCAHEPPAVDPRIMFLVRQMDAVHHRGATFTASQI
jgi:hypothetical protein